MISDLISFHMRVQLQRGGGNLGVPTEARESGSKGSAGSTLALGKSQAVGFVALKAGAEVPDSGGFLCF